MRIKNIKQLIDNVKGVELALSTIITIVLLLIVLIVAATFFLGGADTVLTPIMGVGDEAAGAAEKAKYLEWLT